MAVVWFNTGTTAQSAGLGLVRLHVVRRSNTSIGGTGVQIPASRIWMAHYRCHYYISKLLYLVLQGVRR